MSSSDKKSVEKTDKQQNKEQSVTLTAAELEAIVQKAVKAGLGTYVPLHSFIHNYLSFYCTDEAAAVKNAEARKTEKCKACGRVVLAIAGCDCYMDSMYGGD